MGARRHVLVSRKHRGSVTSSCASSNIIHTSNPTVTGKGNVLLLLLELVTDCYLSLRKAKNHGSSSPFSGVMHRSLRKFSCDRELSQISVHDLLQVKILSDGRKSDRLTSKTSDVTVFNPFERSRPYATNGSTKKHKELAIVAIRSLAV
jgi:hypothetical protein